MHIYIYREREREKERERENIVYMYENTYIYIYTPLYSLGLLMVWACRSKAPGPIPSSILLGMVAQGLPERPPSDPLFPVGLLLGTGFAGSRNSPI